MARSHDSNFSPQALQKPVISEPTISENLSSLEIDKAVRSTLHKGRSLFHLDQKLLAELKPNLILTQELCEVCAPSYSLVKQAAKILTGEPTILSLEPESIEEMFENIITVGEYTDRQAQKVVAMLRKILNDIESKTKTVHCPTVVMVE